MDSQEQKAKDFYMQADKASQPGMFSFLTGGVRWDEVSDLYTKSANAYKMAKNWVKAAESFIKSAEANLKGGSKYNAANDFINAATCYRKTSMADAIKTYKRAIELFTDEGKFNMAAKHHKDLAEICEQETDFESAIDNFQLAADFYEGENSPAAANGCLLKVAQYSGQLERYPKAIEIYEKVGFSSIDNKLLQWSVKDYFMRAALCHLANGDQVSTRKALERYVERDPSFSQQREYAFLTQILAAFEHYDQEAYTAAVTEYDSISRLDPWKTTILLRIKNLIKAEETPLT
eukprot:TRINITY_DN3339_c0_g1_i7.p1 TRINITY_DN3339_c0_g1~~TRINITY_DN3339_c0_g1_i7.p1  ORF type:complete len:322 (-),score=94.90 TRINITY_DN3339_c0_g1_i7:140-1012(-)